MKNFLNLLIVTVCIWGCQTNNQQSSYQKDQDLPKIVEIAVLLPLSGEKAPMGNKLNALINLGLRDGAARNLSVISYDIANTQNLDSVMQKIIDKKTDVILGPILSQNTTEIATKAKASNIPVVSFSNNPAIAGEGIYIFGHGPLQQTKKMIEYLAEQDLQNVILLLPDNPQASNLASVVSDMLVQKHITLAKTSKYLATPGSIDSVVSEISTLIDNLNENPDNLAKTYVYIADEPENLVPLFKALNKYDIDKKAIVCGENKIDIDYREPIEMVFTGSLNVFNSKLSEEILKNKFGSNYLSFWDKMAYDLGLITSYSIGVEDFNRTEFIRRLSNSTGYIGISGALRFNHYIAERKYDIIKRKDSSYQIIEKDLNRF